MNSLQPELSKELCNQLKAISSGLCECLDLAGIILAVDKKDFKVIKEDKLVFSDGFAFDHQIAILRDSIAKYMWEIDDVNSKLSENTLQEAIS